MKTKIYKSYPVPAIFLRKYLFTSWLSMPFHHIPTAFKALLFIICNSKKFIFYLLGLKQQFIFLMRLRCTKKLNGQKPAI